MVIMLPAATFVLPLCPGGVWPPSPPPRPPPPPRPEEIVARKKVGYHVGRTGNLLQKELKRIKGLASYDLSWLSLSFSFILLLHQFAFFLCFVSNFSDSLSADFVTFNLVRGKLWVWRGGVGRTTTKRNEAKNDFWPFIGRKPMCYCATHG